MTLHPRLNNINMIFIRRAAIGLGLGFLFVGMINFLQIENKSYQSDNMIFDAAVISLPENPSDSNDLTDDNQYDENFDNNNGSDVDIEQNETNAQRYEYFAKHKSPLTSEQENAIQNDSPRLSLILSGIGQQQSQIKLILDKLPKSTTIAISPNARLHNDITIQLKEYGFETWMDLATLTLSENTDWGKNALSPSYNFQRNIDLLSMQMANKDNITGLVLPNNSLITETPSLWMNLTQDLFADGFGILDNTAGIIKPALYFFDNNRAPYIKGDITLSDQIPHNDLKVTLASIRKQIIDQKNVIVTIPYSTPVTLDILAEWLNSLREDGITLVPLSAQAKL